MNAPITQNPTKPNRATEVKNMVYHVNYGRWVNYAAHDWRHVEHKKLIEINKRYVQANKQWDNQEDISNFLNDTTGQVTNRIKVEMNYLQITLNQYVGSANKISMRAKCQSFSPLVKVRKEQSLKEMLAWTTIAQQSDPQYASTIMANKPIGSSEAETAQMHENYWCDTYATAINNLLKYSENVNNFNLMKKEGAESLCITGMYVVKPTPMSSDYKMEWIQTSDFFWDRSAYRYDLSDANFMGDVTMALPTEIMERVNMLNDDILAIEAQNIALNTQDRIPVYRCYWRDIDIETWGYIKNEFGDIVLQKIDYVYESEDKPKFTKEDVVSTNELTPYQLDIIKKRKGSGKAMKKMPTEVWRYVEFVPSEYVNANQADSPRQCNDLVLAYGKAPYQEGDIYSAYDMKPPYKVALYLYIDGCVNSPLCIAINPQRMANRIMSAVENIINNSRGSGSILSKESVDKSDYTADEIAIKMKRSEPLILPTAMFGGVPNAVGNYDANIGQGAQHLINMSQMFLQAIESITGVNYAMKGQMDTPNQLVGTMQLMIQRGSVVQERFNAALQECFRQIYQSVATSGKRLYINERPKLVAMIGDEGAKVIELSRDMLLEEFRTTVVFEVDAQTERQYVDSTVMILMQGNLLDQTRASKLFGRGSTDDMWTSVREYAQEMVEAQKQKAEQQQAIEAQQQAQQQGNYDKALAQEDKKIETNKEIENDKRQIEISKELMSADGRRTQPAK
jgi:hypothetical protein